MPQATATVSYSLYASDIGSTSALLNWQGAGPANRFEVRWRKTGDAYWTTTSEIETNSYRLSDLASGQTYEWQLRPDGNEAWQGGPASFTTLYSCSSPLMSYPPYISSTTALVVWASNGAARSEIVDYRVKGTTTWTSILIPRAGNFISSCQLTNLTPATAYEWRARYNCSPYSALQSFTTASCSSVTAQVTPGYDNATFQRTAVPGATATLRWREQGRTDWSVVDSIGNYYTLNNLRPTTRYDYQLAVACGPFSGPTSAPASFSTATCLNTATDLYASGQGVTSTWFSWSGTYYGQYAVQYRQVGDSAWATVPPRFYYGNTTVQVGGLQSATEYEWRVLTYCSNSVSATPTAIRRFSTAVCFVNQISGLDVIYFGSGAILLTWLDAYPKAEQYHVRYRRVGTTTYDTTSTGGSTLFLTSLPPDESTYEWQVAAVCPDSSPGSLSYTTPGTFSTTCEQTAFEPQLISNQVTTVYLGWKSRYFNDKTYPRQYRLRYRMQSGTWTEFSVETSDPSPVVSLTGLAPDAVYEWGVARVCSLTLSTAFTNGPSFSTACTQPAANLSVPTPLPANQVQLRWADPAAYALPVTYRVRYRKAGTSWTEFTTTATGTYAGASLTGLTTNTAYEWAVARQCTPSVSSPFTPGPPFSTTCLDNPIEFILTDQVTATKARLHFEFQYQLPDLIYQIRYRVVGAPTWNVLTNVDASRYMYLLTGLTPYTTYEWQVGFRCDYAQEGGFSASQVFTTDCYVPTRLSSSGGENSATLFWETNPNVTGYHVQYRQQGTTDWLMASDSTAPIVLTNVKGVYEWRVQADCISGLVSDYSPVQSFITLCHEPYALRLVSLNSSTATLSWSSGNRQVPQYILQWRPVGTPNWATQSESVQPPYTLVGLTNGTSYEVRTQTQCGNIQSPFSNTVTFTAICSTPTALSSATYPYGGQFGQQFYWRGSTDRPYTLRWRLIPPANQAPSLWNALTDLSQPVAVTALPPGTYEWQVRGSCPDGIQTAFVGGAPFTLPGGPCLPTTIQNGLWVDAGTWSCGRVPLFSEAVLIRHAITMPVTSLGAVLRIRFEGSGQVRYGGSAALKIGQ